MLDLAKRVSGRVSGLLAAAALALAGQTGAAGAVDEDVFVVARVPVQAEADSAAVAKNEAQANGRRRAMDILLRRLTVEEDWIYLPRLALMGEAPAGSEALDAIGEAYGLRGEEAQTGGGAADPNAPYDPNAAYDPEAAYDPNAAYDPEAAPEPAYDPNAAYDPDAAARRNAADAERGEAKRPVSLSDRDLELLESGFEVYGEKSSSRTYRAYITYRFKPEDVRRVLREARIPYSETQTRTALVIPVLETDNGLYLWEENNPWMAAWKSRPFTHELTPMVAPLGDLEDAARLTARQALDLDEEGLRAMAESYSVSQVIVAHARLRQARREDELTVRLINGYHEREVSPDEALDGELGDFDPETYQAPAQELAQTLEEFSQRVGDVLAAERFSQPSGDFPALAERSIESAISKYAADWKARTQIDHSAEAVLETSAFFRSIGDWTKIRAGLNATPLVASVQVFALSPRGAEMRLKVFGDPQRLAVALENYGVEFWSEGGDHWLLATSGQANQLRGARWLREHERERERERRGLFGAAQDEPRLERASGQRYESAPPTMENQRY